MGQNIWAKRSRLTALPESLRVNGSLRLSDTPIAQLPEGLVVRGFLHLDGTAIQRLPKTLRVERWITPPSSLLDIQQFMGTDRAILSLRGSQHQRMETLYRLRDFPDLLRVVSSLGDRSELHLYRTESGSVRGSIHPVQA